MLLRLGGILLSWLGTGPTAAIVLRAKDVFQILAIQLFNGVRIGMWAGGEGVRLGYKAMTLSFFSS